MIAIAEMGRELGDLWRTTEALDGQQHEARDAAQARSLEWREQAAWDRLYALETMMTESRAVTAEDALVQVILAAGHLSVVVVSVQDESTVKLVEKAHKLLLSAIAALEQAHGVDREAFGGKAYAARWLDPHLVGEAA